ncbi:hypothetical protein C364_06221 [Cryptococcus neoformans Bt63]|nr:hypothetical protein AYX15_02235 [Cryptococcus neoformans var. grubii]OXM76117.1 hypothetical protein C364_06221 [Cryptococcus neoformans var. grubii Bt63]
MTFNISASTSTSTNPFSSKSTRRAPSPSSCPIPPPFAPPTLPRLMKGVPWPDKRRGEVSVWLRFKALTRTCEQVEVRLR